MAGPLVVPPPPPPGGPQATQKTSDVIGNLRPTKLFKLSTPTTYATSLSFDDSGEFLLAACSDESLQLYSAKEGRALKTLFSKKYGAHLARFTHHSQSIIYASTKTDDTIRYLSTHDNQFLRYFKGHTAPVTALALCPASDTFISGSLDNTVRLWSLSSPSPQGKLNLATPTLATYDPSATVIAIASPSTSSILLYDLRNYDKPPFATFDLRALDSLPAIMASPLAAGAGAPKDWTKLEFSNDGKSLIVGTNNTLGHLLLDAFSGELKALLVRPPQYLPLNPSSLRATPWPSSSSAVGTAAGQGDLCFSADGRYVVGGSGGDRDAAVWDVQGQVDEETKTLAPLCGLPCKSRVGIVEWNPRYNMVATADREVVFWLPEDGVGVKPP
ncbi:member of Set1p complex, histone methyl transferase [Xylographa vitiligo]|nr:member of Set1p complex, histone methyl transferase [Xylographa vitiligo]